MKKICKNCKYWEEHNGGAFEGMCRLNMSNVYWMIKFSEVTPRNGEFHTSPSVWAKHDEVRTSPDFGCNQWEKK